jgi:RHS repeat-associated protein
MTCKSINGNVTTYTYNDANELANTGHSFDANGSQTADPGVFGSASYNTLDQTSSLTPSGGSAYSLTYKGFGQAQRLTNGTITQVNDQLGLNEELGTPNTFFTRDPGGAILGERRSGSYYFLHDGLGSISAVIDATGTVVATYRYDPYGNDTGTTGTLYQPIRYTGGYWDGSTSGHAVLYKFGQRYYDSSLGRWTQPDPLNDPLALHGWNGYIYAGDDPVNAIDPSGLRGCGPGSVQVPSYAGMEPACNWHDRCYGAALTRRSYCDRHFLRMGSRGCVRRYGISDTAFGCVAAVHFYYYELRHDSLVILLATEGFVAGHYRKCRSAGGTDRACFILARWLGAA